MYRDEGSNDNMMIYVNFILLEASTGISILFDSLDFAISSDF